MDHIHHRTPLHEACTQGDTRTVRALLEYRADKNALDANAQTPAESAASHNHHAVIKLLKRAARCPDTELGRSDELRRDTANNRSRHNLFLPPG
ncbi:ankyrin repeat domain-containing protein [Rhodopirellula baltica]|uniref:ankyrin repeat domain-containing protein n=1 Tax=Rhodopirellula baltica TaxID=265606 RepID=UPI001F39FD42|nr:ankyrin repeat domain-containing protein [Rhodopirellula baltica]